MKSRILKFTGTCIALVSMQAATAQLDVTSAVKTTASTVAAVSATKAAVQAVATTTAATTAATTTTINKVQSVASQAASTVRSQVANTAATVGKVQNIGVQATSAVKSQLVNTVDATNATAMKAQSFAAGKVASVKSAATSDVMMATDKVKMTAGNATDKVKTLAANATDRIKSNASNATDRIKNTVSEAKDRAMSTAANVADKTRSTVSGAKGFLTDKISNANGSISDRTEMVSNRAGATLSNVESRLSNINNNSGADGNGNVSTNLIGSKLNAGGDATTKAADGTGSRTTADPTKQNSDQMMGSAATDVGSGLNNTSGKYANGNTDDAGSDSHALAAFGQAAGNQLSNNDNQLGTAAGNAGNAMISANRSTNPISGSTSKGEVDFPYTDPDGTNHTPPTRAPLPQQ